MEKETAIEKYTDMMMKGTSLSFSGTDQEKEALALDVMRFLFADVLMWEPEDIPAHFTKDLQDIFNFKVLSRYLKSSPPEVGKNDIDYIVSRCFPDEYKYDYANSIFKTYRAILNGSEKRFRKGTFTGSGGERKLYKLLLLFVSEHIIADDNYSLYRIFADTCYIEGMLKRYKLYEMLHYSIFDGNPLYALHSALIEFFPTSDDGKNLFYADDFLFLIFDYNNKVKKYKRYLSARRGKNGLRNNEN